MAATAFRLLLFSVLGTGAAAAQDVTVYRCAGEGGPPVFQNTPCADGAEQARTDYVRPTDPPVPPPADLAPAPRTLVVETRAPAAPAPQRPEPLFECVRENGETYLSRSGIGARRWVPLWALGAYPRPADAPARAGQSPQPSGASEYAPGTWVEDECRLLDGEEICARLRDELEALRTRFFNAQPSERADLESREDAIQAELAASCGG
ncbi:DUF4124 domain-containing protein [Coralloluteibacterium stylophorae]|uniref:DUF4124 domain-containing protein n=1 Tax=Coralloluteibacterium stylophorae TaxID=1776034 RepID=A0A8J8AX80_9GAMM|nr:DUF4124 domain-containing protein [Coralloluteibacterium stylophorae]MBS7457016.1 hypothetical protein [Coralloluteibacterium stylophorae]